MSLVSVVTPSFNQAPFLEQTIRSVLEQDHPLIEYIVIDGASTDGSLDIIRHYADRLAYWSSEKDRGQADAINKGFSHARGEIVAWLNSDDYYLPGAVSAAVSLFEKNPDVVMVYGDMLAIDATGAVFNRLHYPQVSLEDLLCFQIIGQPAVFMRRSALDAAGGLDLAYHFLLDHQLWIRIACQGKLMHAGQVWAAARYHPAAKNRLQALEFGPEAFRLLQWAGDQPALLAELAPVMRRARASAHRIDARYKLDGGHPAAAVAAWMRAFWLYPPTALARLNILVSASLDWVGLGSIRHEVLMRRRDRLSIRRRDIE
jgi:hypothetical protein